MLKNKILFIFIITVMLFSNSCHSQDKPGKTDKPASIDRKPAVAGQFYPADAKKLRSMLKDMFAEATSMSTKNMFAIICPHAGYVFSGITAASSFNQVDPNREYEDIFVIGASHHFAFDGASIYSKGNFITPLGTVEVDTALANKIIQSNKVFQCSQDYQLPDHCIEVQLPFLQYHLKKKFRIVPILIGTEDLNICKKIAEGLKAYLNGNNLFVISTDFSHYPKYKDAVPNDKRTADAICKNSAMSLVKEINYNFDQHIPELVTSLCGFAAVVSFLYMTENMEGVNIEQLKYMNSGDAVKDSSRVVGYWALAFCTDDKHKLSGTETGFSLSDKDKNDLLKIVRNTLNTYIKDGKVPSIDTSSFSDVLKQNCGAFVTLTINGELRGCIGRFMPDKPLFQIVQDMAISSSTEDYRFNRVSKDELDIIRIEISVLSPLKPIKSADEFNYGKEGIYMTKGGASGTFLPQVADETKWTKEEFLGHCAQDKAGIGWNGWKDAKLYTYTAVVFRETK
ncbi:MAG: AmmeMemoRadiSam system protein B [Bacteroidales bacterium]